MRRRCTLALYSALLMGACLLLGTRLVRVGMAAAAVQSDLAAMESLAAQGLQTAHAQDVVEQLHTAHVHLEALESTARPFLRVAPHLRWVPGYGADIAAAPLLVDVALEVTDTARQMASSLAPLWAEAGSPAVPEGTPAGEAFALTFTAARPDLLAARSAILDSQVRLARLEREQLSPSLQQQLVRLDELLALLERAVDGALVAPDALGAEGPLHYLILLQNEDELRPSGGFISGVAELTVAGGRVVSWRFQDSYAVDDLSRPYPEPPVPLQQTMLADLWLFRDANWSPDFPTSAEQAIALYAIGQGVEADGVLAIDQQGIRLLVEALGPLQVPGYPEVSGDNVIQVARQAWAPQEGATDEWWLGRKEFMAALLEAGLRRVQTEPDRIDRLQLARSLVEALEEKHLLLYLRDAEAAATITASGWGGAQLASAGDYLMVVDANVGFNKANTVVQEQIEYVVDLGSARGPTAVLTIRHHHTLEARELPCRQEPRYGTTYQDLMARCYWDYLRVYVPAGSERVAATPQSIPGSELLSGQDWTERIDEGPPESGRDVWGTFLLVRPGEERLTRFEYLLPPSVVQAGAEGLVYTLVVQKQPGTQGLPLRVVIRPPRGMEMVSSVPAPRVEAGGDLKYDLSLETDRRVSVHFRLGP